MRWARSERTPTQKPTAAAGSCWRPAGLGVMLCLFGNSALNVVLPQLRKDLDFGHLVAHRFGYAGQPGVGKHHHGAHGESPAPALPDGHGGIHALVGQQQRFLGAQVERRNSEGLGGQCDSYESGMSGRVKKYWTGPGALSMISP